MTGLFGWNSKALSYNDEDHGRGGPESFREFLEDCMVKSGLGDGCWRFSVLCLPECLDIVLTRYQLFIVTMKISCKAWFTRLIILLGSGYTTSCQ